MRIISKGCNTVGIQILDNDGKDLLKSTYIETIDMRLEGIEPLRATVTFLIDEIDIEIPEDRITYVNEGSGRIK